MDSATEIPVVDFAGFYGAEASERHAIARRIREISATLGFIYLSGVGILPSEVDRVFAQSAAFFALPKFLKDPLIAAHRVKPGYQCGYVPQGREHEDSKKPSDIKEAFDIFQDGGYIEAAFPTTATVTALSEDVQPFVDAFAAFHERCAAVSNEILRAFALAFALPETFFVSRHRENSTLRLLHYPPVGRSPLAGQMRVGSHTDFGTMTLLFQDPSGGLEVLAADDRWLSAPSIPNTILVNIGDLMQQWTNLEFRSTQHRVAVPSDARVRQSRYSIAFFCEPNNETEVACLPGAKGSERPRFEPVLAGDYLRGRLNNTLIART
ncbi:MAG: 2OG-Fe(II) oxygenase family protein [Candidatus Lustribacter sp.]|jgi:isopenicillin N synthase-like dioxygenase